MGFSVAQWNSCLLVIGVAVAAFSAEAQPAGRRPGQAIVFSSPDGENVSSNLPSLTAKPPEMLDWVNAVPSPGANAGAAPAAELPVLPQVPAISPAQIQQMRRLLDERKNWAMQTPEDLLGLTTPKKILGVTDRDAFGRPKDASVLMQYFNRQDQSQSRTNNGHFGAMDLAGRLDPLNGQGSQFNPDIWSGPDGKAGDPALMNPFSTGATDKRGASARTPQNEWLKSFNLPQPPPKPAPEPQSAMSAFQPSLRRPAAAGGAAKATALGGPLFSSPGTAPLVAPPVTIPIGVSYTPVNSGIGMPAGVTPVPSLFNQSNAASLFGPAWKAQPPPWASSGPQLGVMPQRKFQ
jgi:hypothetical protein